eukprot:m.295790 g.295790  ORF g.295790 m.295790 type:complete len:1008 (-) comp16272_c2_seq5:915-3938(-)
MIRCARRLARAQQAARVWQFGGCVHRLPQISKISTKTTMERRIKKPTMSQIVERPMTGTSGREDYQFEWESGTPSRRRLDKELFRTVGQSHDHVLSIWSVHEKVKKLLQKGANPNWRNPESNDTTVLHYATLWNAASIIRTLIEAGADVNARSKTGLTPLHYALSEEIVRIFHEAGANMSPVDNSGSTPLHEAARIRAKIIPALVAAGANVDCVNNAGQTPRDVGTPAARLELDRVRLSQAYETQAPPDRVMLMLCGNGMVGKTTLTQTLQHGKVVSTNPVSERTYGFDTFEATIPFVGKSTVVDFGGQPEFWVPHGVFLGNQSGVYLVVVNLRDSAATQRTQLRHWLRFIVSRSVSDTRPRVAVVATHRKPAASCKNQKSDTPHDLGDRVILNAESDRDDRISTICDRYVSSGLQEIASAVHTEFSEVLDVAHTPFLVESVDPDPLDEDEVHRLRKWLSTAFEHIRQTRPVPAVCISVANLLPLVRDKLPPISTYREVIEALKDAAGDSIDLTNEDRNRAILSHLWEAGHLMVFEGVDDTVVVDPKAFGTDVIGQLFCPHGNPDFKPLVVNEGFEFRLSQLQEHLTRVGADGRNFGDAHRALKLVSALELVIEHQSTESAENDPTFSIPGRLNQANTMLYKEYRRRPVDCWSKPRNFSGWVYLGTRLKLQSPLRLIPPSEFPRLQHRMSKKFKTRETGFRLWRNGFSVLQCTSAQGDILVEGLVEFNSTLDYIDVCVRSQIGDEKACRRRLTELVEGCSALSRDLECAMLMADSLKAHVDTERHIAHGVGSQELISSPVDWVRAVLKDAGSPSEPTPLPSPSVQIVVSCPQKSSLTGRPPFDVNVFDHCERLFKEGKVVLAFDRQRQPVVGQWQPHKLDVDLVWCMDDTRLQGLSSQDKWDAVQASVKESIWFHGFRNRIEGAILAAAQQPQNQGCDINMICINGGPITSLEHHEMNTIANQVRSELDAMHLHPRISVEYLSYESFCRRIEDSRNVRADGNPRPPN